MSAKGLFENGVWHCDCSPRLPAVHFPVKKEGENKGRWFRCCQKPMNSAGRCKFFLWDSDAQPREVNALASNSTTEPRQANPITPYRGQPDPPPPYSIQAAPSASSRKRARSPDSDDEFGSGELDDDAMNKALVEAETPSKAARTTNSTTPGASRRKLPWNAGQPGNTSANGLQTPQTDRRTSRDPFASRQPAQSGTLFTPSKIDEDGTQQVATPSSSFDRDATPTPSRFKNVAADELVTDVFGLLQEANVRLDNHVERELKSLLSKHAWSAEGYKRGRDLGRTMAKAKDAKITELTSRIHTLEADFEAEKALVKHLQWEAENGSLDV